MNKKALNILVTVLIILAIAVVAFFIIKKNMTGAAVVSVSEDAAKYIGNHSVVYVQAGCSHCIDQENLFGSDWKYMNSIDCLSSSQNMQACIVANITATPTWVINGHQYMGVQSIAELEKLTGYS